MPPPSTITFGGRLLADAVRLREADGTEPLDAAAAEERARDAGGDLEARIVHRAGAMTLGAGLAAALDHVRRAAFGVSLAAALVVACIGAGAARAALGTSGSAPVNFFLVLLTLLGVQTVLLLAWLAVTLIRPRALAGGSLGGLALATARRVSSWLHRGPDQVTAMQALAVVMARSPFGTWSLGAVTHLVWVAFNAGALVLVVILLSARQYTFAWETTILSERTYVPLTEALAAAPRAVGFPVPDRRQIIESRADRDEPLAAAARLRSEAWSGLLIGSLVLYGLGPRLLLLGLSLSLRRRAMKRYRLDLSRPGFRRLQERLLPQTRALGIVDPAESPPALDADQAPSGGAAARPPGAPAIVGYEIGVPGCAWPPPLPGVRWTDLGLIDDRPGRTRVLEALRDGEREPSTVVIVCELTTTPDRGVQRFVHDVRGAVARPVTLVLTSGHRLRSRGETAPVTGRVGDWRRLAEEAGVDAGRVLELDLDHLTDASRAGLITLLDRGEAPTGPGAARRIDTALALIDEHARRWEGAPSREAQSALHVELARLYRDDHGNWAQRLNLPTTISADVTGQLTRGARDLVALLPDRLRRSPRWLAAGAVTGALGCIAAATLISPVAIGALPIWSGLGAAVAAVAQPGGGSGAGDAADATLDDRTTAVRAAALFAVLLELQGRDEATISRTLDSVFADDAAAAIDDVHGWLAERGHRLDLALAQESGS